MSWLDYFSDVDLSHFNETEINAVKSMYGNLESFFQDLLLFTHMDVSKKLSSEDTLTDENRTQLSARVSTAILEKVSLPVYYPNQWQKEIPQPKTEPTTPKKINVEESIADIQNRFQNKLKELNRVTDELSQSVMQMTAKKSAPSSDKFSEGPHSLMIDSGHSSSISSPPPVKNSTSNDSSTSSCTAAPNFDSASFLPHPDSTKGELPVLSQTSDSSPSSTFPFPGPSFPGPSFPGLFTNTPTSYTSSSPTAPPSVFAAEDSYTPRNARERAAVDGIRRWHPNAPEKTIQFKIREKLKIMRETEADEG